jgi:hypothetical protein
MLHCDNLGKDILTANAYLLVHALTRGNKHMPHLATSTGRRPAILLLSDTDIERIARDAEEFDAAYGETIDLLPVGSLVRLTERSRAA